jgi:hypothetical protein
MISPTTMAMIPIINPLIAGKPKCISSPPDNN